MALEEGGDKRGGVMISPTAQQQRQQQEVISQQIYVRSQDESTNTTAGASPAEERRSNTYLHSGGEAGLTVGDSTASPQSYQGITTGHVNVQSCLLIIFQYQPISLQNS